MATGWQKPVYGRTVDQAQIDTGLRQYMLSIYNYMAGGLGVTGLVAFFISTQPQIMRAIFGTPLQWVVMLAPLGIVLFMSFGQRRISASTAQMLFWAFAGLMGLSMASIFLVYTGSSIARIFFITAATFGSVSLYGYTTKKDLSGFGSFLIMGVIGILIASLVNIFIGSTALQFALSVLTVLVFTGLTAYDTQMLKEMYAEGYDRESLSKLVIMGALNLYLDFINIFMALLRLFGDRR
jgi:FtsH-binding integral membrane protein